MHKKRTIAPITTVEPTTTITTTNTTLTTTPINKKVLGYTTYYYSGDKSSLNVMILESQYINEIATATHVVDSNGNITGLIPIEQISFANSNNIIPSLMIGNAFKGDVANMLLNNPISVQNFINNIINILKINNYKGVNVDLEGVYASDRNAYVLLMQNIYETLKPLGYKVSMAVPAKTIDNPNYTWNFAYDYSSLQKYVDYMMIMTYDEHYPGGLSGAIASIGWVTNVLNYALSVIPKEKIYCGLAAYGYDWYYNKAKAYSIDSCVNLSKTFGASILWDNTSQSPYFKYVDANNISHEVWFENNHSIAFKLDLVKSLDIAGVGIWRLGLENVDYWNTIKFKLGI